ncbi:hypothetical protein C770_GR4pB259 (plasmid) [Sinorhizobium meliloti GR4]|nr:hypothetical protein C770_GR4pB259 [Sinorhizobium meliloti GR4]
MQNQGWRRYGRGRRYFVGVASRIELDGGMPVRGRSYAASLGWKAPPLSNVTVGTSGENEVDFLGVERTLVINVVLCVSRDDQAPPSPEEALLDLIELRSPRQSESCRRSAFDPRRRSRSDSTSTFGL